ncbi:MAG: GntR family transcriptional regulator [Solobacterium sp.]|nr:GntR family transcriptional regulator [Solobacterium sp.]MBQ6356674.1 GntR family transcriptional regulator [Solobacterium sp.]
MKMWDIRKELEQMQEHNPFTHLGDAVYTLLYKGIIRMDIAEDELLSDTVLARKLNISRTPVRNALIRLQEDGLIIRTAGQGYVLVPLTKEECAHLMEVRLAVEGQAALRAADRVTGEQLDLLDSLDEQYSRSCREWNIDAMIDSDHRFHQTIVDASANPVLKEIYRQISPRVLHYRSYLFRRSGREVLEPVMSGSVRHHASVKNALRLGFGEVARTQIEKDIYGMTDIIGSW